MSTFDLAPPPSAALDWAWFLDVDGTLIHIAPTPSAIHIPAALPPLLGALSGAVNGALALVSGRALDNIRQLMAPFDPPAAGLHGLEWKDPLGGVHRAAIPLGLAQARFRLDRLVAENPGLVLEDKGPALALHYRQVPHLAPMLETALKAVVADLDEIALLAGKMVFEIKSGVADKGEAVRRFMALSPFSGRFPVFVGDDTTDENGFAAVNDMGGLSVLIGPPRPTLARAGLPDVESCRLWLAQAAGVSWSETAALSA